MASSPKGGGVMGVVCWGCMDCSVPVDGGRTFPCATDGRALGLGSDYREEGHAEGDRGAYLEVGA